MAATRSPSDSPERLRRPVSSSNVFVEDPEDGERQPFFSPCVEGTTQVLESTTHEMLEDGPEVTQRKCAARWPLLLALAALVMFALWMLRRHIGELVNWLAHLAETSGTWGIVGVICILAVWVVALMPISIFEVLVGHVFPLKTALAVCIAGKTIGACTCFGISQRAKPFVERLMRKHRRLRALARTVQAHPLKATLLVRFSMLPAPIKNYGWSSLGVDFWIFFVATLAEAPMRRAHVERAAASPARTARSRGASAAGQRAAPTQPQSSPPREPTGSTPAAAAGRGATAADGARRCAGTRCRRCCSAGS